VRFSPDRSRLGIRWAILLANCLWAGSVAVGQGFDLGAQGTSPGVQLPNNGFHLYFAGSGGYSSIKAQSNLVTPGLTGGESLEGPLAWASATVGYSHYNAGTGFGFDYSPSYTHVADATEQGFNQRLDLRFFHQFASQWTVFVTAGGSEADIQESLFALQTQAVNGSAAGTSPNVPVVFSPAQTLLYGARVFSLSANAGVTYSPSTRLHFSLYAGGSQTQAKRDTAQPIEDFIPRTRSESGAFEVDYNVTPTLQFGGDATYSLTSSVLGQFRTEGTDLHLGKRLGRRWFLLGTSGFGIVNNQPSTLTFLGSGSISFLGRQNTWTVTARRMAGDAYGIGSSASEYYSTTWNWRPRTRVWSIQSNADWQQQNGSAFGNIDTWDVGLGISRKLGRQVGAAMGGSYLRERIKPAINLSGEIAYAVRLTIYWIPLARDAGPLPDVP
jgi:hypothetical protein